MEIKVQKPNERLDKYLASNTEYSRTTIEKMLDNGIDDIDDIITGGKMMESGKVKNVDEAVTITSFAREVKDNYKGPNREKWEKAIKESQDGIVIMNETIELVYDQFILDQIIFIIYDFNGEYTLITTPKTLTSVKNKISIPDSIKDEPGCIKTRPFGYDNAVTFDTLDHARNAALKLIKENAN